MRLLDLFITYDTALEWQDDDPFLDDHLPPSSDPGTWTANEQGDS